MTEEVKPESLVDCLRKVSCDDTMNLWNQVIRFQYIVDQPVKVQLILDRVHKFKPALSKPLGYLRIGNVGQLLDIAANALASASTLALLGSSANPKDSFAIQNTLDSAWRMLRADVLQLISISLDEIERKKRVLEVAP